MFFGNVIKEFPSTFLLCPVVYSCWFPNGRVSLIIMVSEEEEWKRVEKAQETDDIRKCERRTRWLSFTS